MADELERLTAQFDADITGFNKKLDQLLGGFNSTSTKIEARNAQLVANINSKFNDLSLTKIAGAVGATALIDKLVEGSKDLAESTLSVSKATGISAENIQGYGLIARQAGIDQDTLTTSLEHFAVQVGDASLKQTDFGKRMAQLGIDLKSGPEVALQGLMDKIGQLPKAQQAAVAQLAFGRGGIANLSWITDGSKNIQAMIANFQKLGLIVSDGKLESVDEIFKTWANLKTEALAGFIDGFSQFAGDVESPQFQMAVVNAGKAMGDMAGFIAQMAPHLPLMIEMFVAWKGLEVGAKAGTALGELTGNPVLGGIGALIGGAGGFLGTKALLDKAMSGAPGASPAATGSPSGSLVLPSDQDKADADKTAAYIAKLQYTLSQQIADSAKKARDSASDMVKAHNDALVQMAQGTAAYYDVQKKAIEDEAAADIQKTFDEQEATVNSINDRAFAQQAAAKNEIKDQTQLAAVSQQIRDAAGVEETAAAQTTSDKIVAINDKKNAALLQNDWQYQESLQSLIQINDTLRDGIESIAAAGVTGFKSMEQAVSDLVLQFAQLILKLYVVQPLMDKLLGPSGTTGGGLIGNLFGNLFGGGLFGDGINPVTVSPINSAFSLFAGGGYTGPGGVNQPAGIVHRGEVVFSQDDVKRFGGVNAVERLRMGYADGGIVGMPAMPRSAIPVGAAANPVQVTILLRNESDSSADASVGGGGPGVDVVFDQIMARNITRQGSKTSQALRGMGVSQPLTRR